MRLLPYGESGWLLDCDDAHEAQRWFTGLSGADTPDFADVVLGARTVLVATVPGAHRRAHRVIESTEPRDPQASDVDDVTIRVRYDGPDLEDVARHLGLSTTEVVDLHTASAWTVAFSGFVPGFGYLTTDHERLTVPRRASPRPRIAAGSVGLAGSYSGVYPKDSPGGWQIIGHTDTVLWSVDRDPPALFRAGCLVTFEAVS